MRSLSLFHHNNSSLALFGLFLQEVQGKKLQKQPKKVQVNYSYGETKRESLAGNSNRENFLNCDVCFIIFLYLFYVKLNVVAFFFIIIAYISFFKNITNCHFFSLIFGTKSGRIVFLKISKRTRVHKKWR